MLLSLAKRSCRCKSSLALGRNVVTSLRGDPEAESEAKAVLRLVNEPLTGRSLTSLGSLRGLSADRSMGSVHVELDMLVPGHPMLPAVKDACTASLKELSWVQDVTFTDLSLPNTPRGVNTTQPALANVQHCIAVSSCKGGVGKTTVAVNLAMSLASRGLRVGILDADIYGPSVPLLLPAADNTVRRSKERQGSVLPLQVKGQPNLTMLSFGHVSPQSGAPGSGGTEAAVMRGPIASRVINQLVAATEWGCLDYLIVDMPPGTGDIQITLTQAIAFSGAVVVTTPHALSAADAVKGVAAFDQLQVPILALVENMSYFDADDGTRYHPFGKGAKQNMLKALRMLHGGEGGDERSSGPSSPENRLQAARQERARALKASIEKSPWHQLPLCEDISSGSELWAGPGSTETNPGPISLRNPESMPARIYSDVADSVVKEIFQLKMNAELVPSLNFSSDQGVSLRYFSATAVQEYHIPVWELRSRDPATGKRLDTEGEGNLTASELQQKFANIEPKSFDIKGNYGVSFVWSDDYYMDIFPFEVLRRIAEEICENR